MSLCEDRGSLIFGKKLSATSTLDGSSATLTIIDLTILEQAILTK
jgi:hypothetical protein